MNLIQKDSTNPCTISNFRAFQFSYIKELFACGINYIKKHGYPHLINYEMKVIPNITIYNTYKQSYTEKYSIIDLDLQKPFLEVIIPELLYDTFFILHGNKYIPSLYISDPPITIKKSSIKIYSLFAPLTIYYNNKRVIFLNNNIPLKHFMQLLFGVKHAGEYLEQLEITNVNFDTDQNVYSYFSKLLGTEPDQQLIIKKLNDLIFDDWSNQLYYKIYDSYPNIKSVVKQAIYAHTIKQEDDFINLNKKRLVFIENILKPYFKGISMLIDSAINKNKMQNQLSVPLDSIIKNFITGLQLNYHYDCVNGYSSLISHKASFKNPFGEKSLPPCVNNIHSSHKNRICPVTVSNTEPGIVTTLIPDQNVDFQFGIFY